MSRKIAVVGFEGTHKVVENLGFNHTVGKYAKAVLIDGHDRIVTSFSRSGPWSINRPVIDVAGIERQLQENLA